MLRQMIKERQCEWWSGSCHSHFIHQVKSHQYQLKQSCMGPRAGMDTLEIETLNQMYCQFMLQGSKSLTRNILQDLRFS
jgi:hypothetical protein